MTHEKNESCHDQEKKASFERMATAMLQSCIEVLQTENLDIHDYKLACNTAKISINYLYRKRTKNEPDIG